MKDTWLYVCTCDRSKWANVLLQLRRLCPSYKQWTLPTRWDKHFLPFSSLQLWQPSVVKAAVADQLPSESFPLFVPFFPSLLPALLCSLFKRFVGKRISLQWRRHRLWVFPVLVFRTVGQRPILCLIHSMAGSVIFVDHFLLWHKDTTVCFFCDRFQM